MRYLIVFEDGKLYQSDEINEETRQAWEDGLLDIVDMKESKCFAGKDEWYDLEKWEENNASS